MPDDLERLLSELTPEWGAEWTIERVSGAWNVALRYLPTPTAAHRVWRYDGASTVRAAVLRILRDAIERPQGVEPRP